jgi:hypothetical protein
LYPIDTTLAGTLSSVSPVSEKANAPILVKLAGKATLSREVHP